ncbi:myeloid cell surface antigen CD33-like isoform X2 [Sardina pilchardus]|uniref:myeloid cell surface antigen CD33-like isoform X2 n=1 Tax=Sardina pilchardus TaxID=27697 RepID=UPI002E11E4B4
MLIIIIIYILHFQGYVVCNGWTAQIPPSVDALENSCVVVSCTYEYPNTDGKTITIWRPSWSLNGRRIYRSDTTAKNEKGSQNHTSMPGNIKENNCSLQIDSVRQADAGPYLFRIEMPELDNYSYKHNKAKITVKVKPDPPSLKEVRSGNNVIVSCSVSHSCPPHPPTITWSRDGTITVQSVPPTGGLHKLTSNLTFSVDTLDHQQPIICSVQHHGGKKSNRSINITAGNSGSIPDDRDVNDKKHDVVHTTQAPASEEEDSVPTVAPEETTLLPTAASLGQEGPLIKIISVVVPLLIIAIAIAMLVGFKFYRKHKRKQNTQPNLYADKKTGDRPCLEMSDEVYANTEVITAGKDVGDEDDIYANTEFLESKNPAIWMNHGLGSATEPDEDIYANM